jgi:hypothetical protein
MFLEGFVYKGQGYTKLKQFDVIRTDHRPHPMLKRKTYRRKNVMVNDTPFPFLELYSQARLTLSNRMHACVAAAAYGNHAMLFSQSPRIRLLERLGLENIQRNPVKLDPTYLECEKRELVQFLRSLVSEP